MVSGCDDFILMDFWEAIEKGFADLFKQVHFSNCSSKLDQYSPLTL